jgi:sulfide:quinone oxidoreductase
MAGETIKQVTQGFYVAPQLRPEDFAAAAALGIKTVINNRPDGESADQLSDETARRHAEAAGLAYHFVPVVSGQMTQAAIQDFMATVDEAEGPVLAYCRSGTRSCFLWAFAAARSLPLEEVVTTAQRAGYDVSPALPVLERIASGQLT